MKDDDQLVIFIPRALLGKLLLMLEIALEKASPNMPRDIFNYYTRVSKSSVEDSYKAMLSVLQQEKTTC